MESPSLESTAVERTASQPKESLSAGASFLGRVLESARFWWIVCLGCAAVLALADRHYMNPDGLSYLDMASEALRGGPRELINGLWSPGYPALLSVALALFHPAPRQEFPLVHFVNFFIFVLNLWAFHFFLRNWLAYLDTFKPTSQRGNRDLVPFAFCAFLLFTLGDGGIEAVNPDFCMAAAVYLVAGLVCRLSLADSGMKHYAALGFALGLGYYAKSPMLPLGLILIGGLILYPSSVWVSRKMLLCSLAVFLLTAAPLVTLLSQRAGHLSFGEAGKLNYAWHVNGLQPYAGWLGSDTGQPLSSLPTRGLVPHPASASDSHRLGSPEHAPRILTESPLILEFSSPVKGTFPLWYDPAYWYAGAKARFDPRQQLAALKVSLEAYQDMLFFSQKAAFLAGAIVLCFLTARKADFTSFLRTAWLWVWPLFAMSMYVLVHVEKRYLAVFLVLLWVGIYGVLMSRVSRQAAAAVCAAVAVTMMIPFTISIAETSVVTAGNLLHSTPPDYETVALGLRKLGVRTGDRLAVVGFPFDTFYARYDGLRVVAAIPATDEFWNLSAPELNSVADKLRGIGVKAVVAQNRSGTPTSADWRDIKVSGPVRFSVLPLYSSN